MKLVVCTFVLLYSVFCHSLPTKTITLNQLAQGAVALDGMWAFDWQELHIEFNKPVKDGINLPGLWHQQGTYTPQGYGTLRLRVKLPEFQTYYLRVPDVPSAVALWVNGELIYRRGVVSHLAASERPEFAPEVVQLPANDHYDVILHVSNHHHKDGGVWHRFLLADETHQYALGSQSRLIDAMVFSFLMVVSIYLLLINLSRRGSLTHILFAGFIWAIAFRSVMVGERIAYEFIHDVSWLTWQRLEHVLLFLALPLFIYFFQRFFALRNSWFAHAIAVISAGMVIATFVLPAYSFTQLGVVSQVLGLITIIYMVVMLALLIKQKMDYAVMFLVSFIVWASLVMHDYLYTHLWIQSRPLAQFGLIAFVVFQLIILWKRRRHEMQMLMYVRGFIDHQVKEIEASAQTQSVQIYSINEFIKDLSPYLQVLNVSIEHKPCDMVLSVPRDGLKQAILMLARMAEREGRALHLRTQVNDEKKCMLLDCSIYRSSILQDMQSQAFNAAMETLHKLGLSFTKNSHQNALNVTINVPVHLTDEHIQIEKSGAKKTFGHQAALPVLFCSDHAHAIIEPLQDYFYLIQDDINLSNISKHRPKMVLWQIHQWHSEIEYHIESIKQKYPSLPIVLIVDGFYKTQLARCIRLGITDYVLTPFLSEELILKIQRQINMQSEENVPQISQDIRDVTVTLVRTCVALWQKYSGKNKTDLAEASRLWRVYMDGSTAKTRTLDKYLSLQTLPKNPRWETVNRTAHFVFEQCQLDEADRQTLNQQLSVFNRLLAN